MAPMMRFAGDQEAAIFVVQEYQTKQWSGFTQFLLRVLDGNMERKGCLSFNCFPQFY
jgi:hypothetical protein